MAMDRAGKQLLSLILPFLKVKNWSLSDPRGRPRQRRARTITFTTAGVHLVAVASPAGGPDETFRIAGLVNPALIVPAGAQVSIQVINAEPDTAHGLVITASQDTSIAVLLGALFVPSLLAALLPQSWQDTIGPYLPLNAGESAYTVQHQAHALQPWTGLGVFCLYTAAALAAGFILISRRDA